ncbi:MAG: hypothetical protein WCK43_06385, partial [bacterium]
FRAFEEKTLRELNDELRNEASVMIVVGAGYCSNFWPSSFKLLWLQRDSDQFPRYFLDRPLVGTSDPLNFEKNFQERELRYRSKADCVWTLREGEDLFSTQVPTSWIFKELKFENESVLTLFPNTHRDLDQVIEAKKSWNLVFELRNDLWSFEKDFEKIKKLVLKYPQVRFLLSFRKLEKINVEIFSLPNVLSDWEIKLGLPPSGLKVSYFSLHDLSESLTKELKNLEGLLDINPGIQLKAAPDISSFEDLEILYKWWLQNPSKKNIFPRSPFSKSPRWQWFRLFMKGKQRLNFLREGREGLADQPTLCQWSCQVDSTRESARFAAILGDPVLHSYSPVFHHEFFKKKHMNFYAIPLSKEELNEKVFAFLDELGACAFAVTSPLKKHEFLLKNSTPIDANADQVHNTLFKIQTDSKTKIWKRANTDIEALKKMLNAFSSSCSNEETSWVIWGSGAIAEQAFDLLQNVELYSASQGECLKKKGKMTSNVCLLWAAGDQAPLPSFKKIQKVLDLSYSSKSNARLYCFDQKIPYLSGLEFFQIQARAQQQLWDEL